MFRNVLYRNNWITGQYIILVTFHRYITHSIQIEDRDSHINVTTASMHSEPFRARNRLMHMRSNDWVRLLLLVEHNHVTRMFWYEINDSWNDSSTNVSDWIIPLICSQAPPTETNDNNTHNVVNTRQLSALVRPNEWMAAHYESDRPIRTAQSANKKQPISFTPESANRG